MNLAQLKIYGGEQKVKTNNWVVKIDGLVKKSLDLNIDLKKLWY